ncbi:MAG: hypothetical protein JRN08_05205 [Nitrososphaerota archaeon]|nr:hypothetical protein [Nitrososphaerota archaeon]
MTGNPLAWLAARVPRSMVGAEAAARSLLKLVFWAALLAPVILVPAYYLLVVAGLAPQVRLPPG